METYNECIGCKKGKCPLSKNIIWIVFIKKRKRFWVLRRFLFVTNAGQGSRNYELTWAATIAADEILLVHRSCFPPQTSLATKWRILGNDRAVKFGEKNYFCMLFDLFHVLLKPKIINRLQYLCKTYSCEAYSYFKKMALIERKLNTVKRKPEAERISKHSWNPCWCLLPYWYRQHISWPKETVWTFRAFC